MKVLCDELANVFPGCATGAPPSIVSPSTFKKDGQAPAPPPAPKSARLYLPPPLRARGRQSCPSRWRARVKAQDAGATSRTSFPSAVFTTRASLIAGKWSSKYTSTIGPTICLMMPVFSLIPFSYCYCIFGLTSVLNKLKVEIQNAKCQCNIKKLQVRHSIFLIVILHFEIYIFHFYPIASKPPTSSLTSRVMAACRTLLNSSVSSSDTSSALLDAFFIATIRAECSEATLSVMV